jgi:hypothetical protein
LVTDERLRAQIPQTIATKSSFGDKRAPYVHATSIFGGLGSLGSPVSPGTVSHALSGLQSLPALGAESPIPTGLLAPVGSILLQVAGEPGVSLTGSLGESGTLGSAGTTGTNPGSGSGNGAGSATSGHAGHAGHAVIRRVARHGRRLVITLHCTASADRSCHTTVTVKEKGHRSL